jgi:hypothetical protein
MFHSRSLIVACTFALAGVLPLGIQSAHAAAPVIYSASVTGIQLTVNGSNMAPGAATVTLGNTVLPLPSSQTASQLVVSLPGVWAPGTYALTVKVSGKGTDSAVVAIAAAGPKGDPGAPGTPGLGVLRLFDSLNHQIGYSQGGDTVERVVVVANGYLMRLDVLPSGFLDTAATLYYEGLDCAGAGYAVAMDEPTLSDSPFYRVVSIYGGSVHVHPLTGTVRTVQSHFDIGGFCYSGNETLSVNPYEALIPVSALGVPPFRLAP